MTTNSSHGDPKIAGALSAMQTLADSIGLSLEDAIEAARTGQLADGRTVAEAL